MMSSIVRSSSSIRRTYVWGVTLLLVAGCSASGSDSGVPWDDYSPDLRERIDDLGDTADCAALQDEFDAADANNAATKARTGHNNAGLLAYIDAVMRDAGCYGG